MVGKEREVMGNKMYTDGVGHRQKAPLPKLNTMLLEECVNWAIRSYRGTLQPGEPAHNQGDWGRRFQARYRTTLNRFLSNWGYHIRETNLAKVQQNYCGTSYCIAGYAAQVTGNLQWPEITQESLEMGDVEVADRGHTRAHHVYEMEPQLASELVSFNNGVLDFSYRPNGWHTGGAEILGLTEHEACELFNGSNEIGKVIRIAENIAASRGETLVLIEH